MTQRYPEQFRIENEKRKKWGTGWRRIIDYSRRHRSAIPSSCEAERTNEMSTLPKRLKPDELAVAAQVMAQLYQVLRLYVNFFQPSFKLLEKTRDGGKVKKSYLPPAIPCDRLLEHAQVPETVKFTLRTQRSKLDPIELLHRIREAQSALASLVSSAD